MVGGRYRIQSDSALALGSLVAWHARDEVLDRAVIVIDVNRTASVVEGATGTKVDVSLVLDAARRAGLITDRRLVKLLDVSQSAQDAYIVTEVPGGESLATLGSSVPWDAVRGRALLGELSTCLEAASSRGVHHQDVSRDTIFLTAKGPRVFGLGFLALLLGRDVSQGEDAAIVDTDQVRALGHQVLSAREVARDAALTEVLDDRKVFVRPAQLAAKLDPWDSSSLIGLVPDEGTRQATDSAPKDATSTATVRKSAKERLSQVNDDLNPPGTPPPATPTPGTGITGPTGLDSAFGAVPARVSSGVVVKSATESLLAPVLTAQNAPAAPAFLPVSAGSAGGAGAAAPGATRPGQASKTRRRRFQVSSTFVILVLVAGLVGTAGYWAYHSIGADLGPTHEVRSLRQTGIPTPTASGDDDTPVTGPTETPTDPPVIDSGAPVDPDGDGDEHPELVDRAFDSDQQTSWISRRYASADFGGINKRGIGYAITLEKPALVSAIYLITGNTGGEFEIRSTTADDPDGGELLEKGSFDTDMTIELSTPVETDSLVLWVTSLPDSSDGFRLSIAEISLL